MMLKMLKNYMIVVSGLAGYTLQRGHPGLYLAAFNKQKQKSKDLASYGYASLKASELLSNQ